MFQSLAVGGSGNERRRVLAIVENPHLRSLISTFLLTMGCACNLASSGEAETSLDREIFDAVLLDSDLSTDAIENTVLKIKESRPSLSTRILVMRSALVTPEVVELIERHNLHQMAQESLLQQLWGVLQELFACSHSVKMAPQTMHTAQVIFDTSRSPLPANLRASRRNYRLIAYQHRNATIDVQIKPRDDSGRISITGQLLCTPQRKGESDHLPVLIISAMRTMTRTSTNEFGEFHLECQPVSEVCVQMRLQEGAWLSLPLGELDWPNATMSK